MFFCAIVECVFEGHTKVIYNVARQCVELNCAAELYRVLDVLSVFLHELLLNFKEVFMASIFTLACKNLSPCSTF